MNEYTAKFAPGSLVVHRLFEYRGVVTDVDPYFKGTPDWYDNMARSKPPKDRPWYHVLVDGGAHRTYVAERNLEPDETGQPINHPAVTDHFETLSDGAYVPRQRPN